MVWKLSWNVCTLHTRSCAFGAHLYAQSALMNKTSALELSRMFSKSALLVGWSLFHPKVKIFSSSILGEEKGGRFYREMRGSLQGETIRKQFLLLLLLFPPLSPKVIPKLSTWECMTNTLLLVCTYMDPSSHFFCHFSDAPPPSPFKQANFFLRDMGEVCTESKEK